MKALIVTINDGVNYNYGNKLQNLAIVTVMCKLGIDSETLNFEVESDKDGLGTVAKGILMKITGYRLARSESSKIYWKYKRKRIKNFRIFCNKYLEQHDDFKLTDSDGYDYYITGSDQVWNPEFFKYHKLKKNAYLLKFCKENDKKICFSPSFGIPELPDEWKPHFRKYLSMIPKISVRENEGAAIVKELTGKDATVLIDPTLMLSAKDWIKYSAKPKNVDTTKKYLLTYFLGEVSPEVKEYINSVAKENNLEIYNLLDPSQPDLYVSGPSEFIYMISKASLVITDSFHACVFSFIFKKPFSVFNRKSEYSDMSSRLDTFLGKFGLDSRKGDINNHTDIFVTDYDESYRILKKERRKVLDYLSDSMHIDS